MPDFERSPSASFISSNEGETPLSFNRLSMNSSNSYCFLVNMRPSLPTAHRSVLVRPGQVTTEKPLCGVRLSAPDVEQNQNLELCSSLVPARRQGLSGVGPFRFDFTGISDHR